MLRSPVLLLAGGNSKRAGQPKGLIPFHGRPWLIWQLEKLSEVGVASVILVAGNAAESYRKILPLSFPVLLVENPNPDLGQFSSIQCGVRVIPPEANGLFILPLDTPVAKPETWSLLEMASTRKKAVVPLCGDHGGHPVWMSREFCREVETLPKDSRLDILLRSLKEAEISRVSVEDERIVLNLNTRELFSSFEQVTGA